MEKNAVLEENATLKQEIQDLTVNKVSTVRTRSILLNNILFRLQENLTAQCSSMDQLAVEHKSLKACLDKKHSEYEALQNKVCPRWMPK